MSTTDRTTFSCEPGPDSDSTEYSPLPRARRVPDAGEWQPGDRLPGGYRVIEKLGTGGMGSVYLVDRIIGRDPVHFAVKILHVRTAEDPRRRALFLRELRTWIDLPDHPHLNACRFARTIGTHLAVFAEYVDGGTLKQWLAAPAPRPVREILDMAIQAAWGLDAAHRVGVIHQDVKPANILLTSCGEVKITDFGLSRALAAPDSQTLQPGSVVTGTGLTPAYCSPEQAEGAKLTVKTDIWSWGLSVLEMFCGGVFWDIGAMADTVLDLAVSDPARTLNRPIPDPVIELLRRCFRIDPSDRWADMAAVADRLTALYGGISGSPYPRRQPSPPDMFPATGSPEKIRFWQDHRDPINQLLDAALTAGIPASRLEGRYAGPARSYGAELVRRMEILVETERIYMDLYARGHTDVVTPLMAAMSDHSRYRELAGDITGAVRVYDRALEFLAPLRHQSAESYAYAASLLNKANLLLIHRDPAEAIPLYDDTIALLTASSTGAPNERTRRTLARACLNKAQACLRHRDDSTARTLIASTIEIREQLASESGDPDIHHELAYVYVTSAVARGQARDYSLACDDYNRAEGILRRLTAENTAPRYLESLALAFQNHAVIQRKLDRVEAAVDLNRQAFEIWQRLIRQTRSPSLFMQVAIVHVNQGNALRDLAQYRSALKEYDAAESILERMIYMDGRFELLDYYVRSICGRARIMGELKRVRTGLKIVREAEAIWEWEQTENACHLPHAVAALIVISRLELLCLAGRSREAATLARDALSRLRPHLDPGNVELLERFSRHGHGDPGRAGGNGSPWRS